MPGPRLNPGKLWHDHVEAVLVIVRGALRSLSDVPLRPTSGVDCRMAGENAINRELYFAILDENSAQAAVGSPYAFNHPPAPEANNLPSPEDARRVPREDKRPDLQWNIIDHLQPSSRSVKSFVIECKLLGTPRRSDWPFNENYVHHGICRFIERSHLYGKGDTDGAMVGYVQSMLPRNILDEVNGHAAGVSVPSLVPRPGAWPRGPVWELGHDLARPAGGSPYRLNHLWVDLRPGRDG